MKKTEATENPFAEVNASMRPLFSDLKDFLLAQAEGFTPEVRNAALESISPSGKFLRPTLVFCSASVGGYDRASLIRRAAIVELIHLSTLIHDDVIDGASMRHGELTPNHKYGARTAILLGDVIFSQTMLMACDENSLRLSRKAADSVRVVCEGEVRQTLSRKDSFVTREKYYEVAFGKTAALFALACDFGADAAKNASSGWLAAAEVAGKQLGIAYQIYDDVCDWFMSEDAAGKTLGTDLAQGRRTLPVIILMERISRAVYAEIDALPDSEKGAALASAMRNLGVLEECRAEFEERIGEAEKHIASFGKENSKLLDFCAAMRALKFS